MKQLQSEIMLGQQKSIHGPYLISRLDKLQRSQVLTMAGLV